MTRGSFTGSEAREIVGSAGAILPTDGTSQAGVDSLSVSTGMTFSGSESAVEQSDWLPAAYFSWSSSSNAPNQQPLHTGSEPSIPPETTRERNRAYTSRIPPEEREAVSAERERLIKKRFSDEGISPSEELRLRMVEWQIDRFEDADAGPQLDDLERFIESQEAFAREIEGYVEQVHGAVSAQRSRNRFRGRRR